MNRPLRVAFVGMKRPPSDMPGGYWETFVKFHLELPYYYARFSKCEVDLTTVEPVKYELSFPLTGGSIRTLTESQFLDHDFDPNSQPYDVVVHWRKWFDELYVPGARNVILSQDHTYSSEWLGNVGMAYDKGKLDGILVFPTWHYENTARELNGLVPAERLYQGMTLGVDCEVYYPTRKDPHHLLWASDPGRGLDALVTPFLRLRSRDRRYRLTVTYPDYVRPESVVRFSQFFKHPAVTVEPSLRNGPKLWDLFNTAGVLPYSSTFHEPSSRCHRQAMAAGCMVLYPPNMGTPSRLIESGLNGIVEDPIAWPEIIHDLVSTSRSTEIGQNARSFALTESWAVQAARFHSFFSKGLQ